MGSGLCQFCCSDGETSASRVTIAARPQGQGERGGRSSEAPFTQTAGYGKRPKALSRTQKEECVPALEGGGRGKGGEKGKPQRSRALWGVGKLFRQRSGVGAGGENPSGKSEGNRKKDNLCA